MEDAEKNRVIIIEDELPNSRMLQGLTYKLRPHWQVEAILESVEESVLWLKNHLAPDLILMDIQLSDGTCFSIFKQYELHPHCRIIFTTAYDEYAIRAFKVNSIDYLLKPINEDELELAFQKFERLKESTLPSAHAITGDREYYANLIKSILEGRREYRKRFLISGVHGYQKLETKVIACFFINQKQTFAMDFERNQYILDSSLEQLESELDPTEFFRANRKVIVNIDTVASLLNEEGGKLKVVTIPETVFDITVSRLKAGEFKQWMGK